MIVSNNTNSLFAGSARARQINNIANIVSYVTVIV